MYPPLLFEEEYLTWKEGSGWFDCNKTFNYYGDGNMCWAAAASNLIHWWLAQNQNTLKPMTRNMVLNTKISAGRRNTTE